MPRFPQLQIPSLKLEITENQDNNSDMVVTHDTSLSIMPSISPGHWEQLYDCVEVIEIYVGSGNKDGAQVTLMLDGERLAITLISSTSVERNTKVCEADTEGWQANDRSICLFCRSVSTEDYEEQLVLEDEALEPILVAIKSSKPSIVTPISKTLNQTSQILDLHDLLFPKTSYYRLEARGARHTLVPIDDSEAYGRTYGEKIDTDDPFGGNNVKAEVDASLPQYTPEQIQVLHELVSGGGTVCHVRVGNQDMLCKARHDGLNSPSLEREANCLLNLSSALPDLSAIRVPALLGYVKHPGSNAVLGILREWVSSDSSLGELEKRNFDGVSKERREKWGHQITQTVGQLHTFGVAWGDAKPDNVVIDLNDDAWLIDFGGGWTHGWVDAALQGTIHGDNQALEKMVGLLRASS